MSERGGSGRYTIRGLQSYERRRGRKNGRLDCHTRLESKTYKFCVAANGATSIAPSLGLSAMITEEGLHCRTDSRIKVEKLQQSRGRVIEDVAPDGGYEV